MTLNQKILILNIVGNKQTSDTLAILPSNGVKIQTDEDGLFEEVLEVEQLPSEAFINSKNAFDADFAHELENEPNDGPQFEPRKQGWDDKTETKNTGFGGSPKSKVEPTGGGGWDSEPSDKPTDGGWGSEPAVKAADGGWGSEPADKAADSGWNNTPAVTESGDGGWGAPEKTPNSPIKKGWDSEPTVTTGGWGGASPTVAEPRSPESSNWGESANEWAPAPKANTSSWNDAPKQDNSGANKFERFATGDEAGFRNNDNQWASNRRSKSPAGQFASNSRSRSRSPSAGAWSGGRSRSNTPVMTNLNDRRSRSRTPTNEANQNTGWGNSTASSGNKETSSWGTKSKQEGTSDGWGSASPKESNTGGWGTSSSQPSKTVGWGSLDSSSQPSNVKSSGGWGEPSKATSSNVESSGGWGEPSKATSSNWDTPTQSGPSGDGWGKSPTSDDAPSAQVTSTAGWGESESVKTAGWDVPKPPELSYESCKDAKEKSAGWGDDDPSKDDSPIKSILVVNKPPEEREVNESLDPRRTLTLNKSKKRISMSDYLNKQKSIPTNAEQVETSAVTKPKIAEDNGSLQVTAKVIAPITSVPVVVLEVI